MSKDSGKCPSEVLFFTACPICRGEAEVHTLYANDEAEATCLEGCGEVVIPEFYP